MNRKIRVLHLISHMNDGGAQRIVLNYLNDLSKIGSKLSRSNTGGRLKSATP